MEPEEERAMLRRLIGDGRVGGRYVVERVLGVGGMGLVAAARYPELDQEVAIKFMRPELASDTTLSARFLREARLAARAKSPHFVRVFDFGKLDSGVPYLVMEMLSGRDLGAELEKTGPMSVDSAADYVLQAAMGLAELHALGIVHRDLKPANLFLADAAGTRVLKVLDLGLTTDPGRSGPGLTSTGHVFGTPHYMSPEQIKESKSVDPRSDVWALGVILYELLTGSLPFGQASESTGEVFGLILHTEPVPVRKGRPDLPVAVEAIIQRCMMRQPLDRYADVGELAAALQPFAGPASTGRAEAVRRALDTRPEEPLRPLDALPEPAPPIETAPTVQAGAPIARPLPGATSRVDQPTGAGPFARATSGSEVVPSPPKDRRIVVVAALAAAAGIAAVVVVFTMGGSKSGAPSSAQTPLGPAAITAVLSSQPAVPSAPIALAPAAETAARIAPLASASASSAVPVRPRPVVVGPRVAPAAATAAATHGSVLDGLDRK